MLMAPPNRKCIDCSPHCVGICSAVTHNCTSRFFLVLQRRLAASRTDRPSILSSRTCPSCRLTSRLLHGATATLKKAADCRSLSSGLLYAYVMQPFAQILNSNTRYQLTQRVSVHFVQSPLRSAKSSKGKVACTHPCSHPAVFLSARPSRLHGK
jgi:hypothetical protein